MATSRRRTMTLAIEVDDSGVDGSIKGVEATVSKFGRSVDVAVGNIAARAFEVGAGAARDFAGEILDLAANSETYRRRASVVFGENIEDIERWADRNKRAFGTSQEGVLNMAAAIGDLLIPLGFTREQAAEIVPVVVEAGNAFSEFTGQGFEFSIEAIGKALLAEREQLKSLGIVVREEDLKLERLDGTFQGVTASTEAQAKALDTLTLIMERGGDALSEYENRQGTLIEEQKNFNSELEESKQRLADAAREPLARAFDLGTAIFEGAELVSTFGDLDRASTAVKSGFFLLRDAFPEDRTRIFADTLADAAGNGELTIEMVQTLIEEAQISEEEFGAAAQALRDWMDDPQVRSDAGELVSILGKLEEAARKARLVAEGPPELLGIGSKSRTERADAIAGGYEDGIERIRKATEEFDAQIEIPIVFRGPQSTEEQRLLDKLLEDLADGGSLAPGVGFE